MSLTWSESREIGELLFEKYDSVNPRSVRPGDLLKWVVDLEDFTGKPEGASEDQLKAIQAAWFDEWKGEYGDD